MAWEWEEILTGLITGGPATCIAIYGLATARSARAKAIEAEREARHSDELRMRILTAGESLLGLVGDIITSIASVRWLLEREADAKTIRTAYGAAAVAAVELRKLLYRNSAFLPGSFQRRLFTFLSEVSELALDREVLSATEGRLQEFHLELTAGLKTLARLP
jgi:hypothetical protein